MSFAGILKQSTAVNVIIGPFVDSADGDAEETALTIAQADVRLSKNAGADAQKNDATSAAHEGDGFYMCEFDATDTNTVGQLTLWVHVAGALAVRHDFQIVEEAVYDALFGASALGYVANAPVNVAQFGGSNLTATGGRPEVNTSHISGDSAAADNAEAFFDGTGYAGTNNVIPTVTTLTNAPADSSGVTTLLTRLSALRAGYLDNLSAGAVALEASITSVLSKLLKYTQLIVRKDAAIATDNATEVTAINANGGSGGGAFANTTDSQEAIRDNMGTAQTGDAFARLGAPAGASVSADIAAAKVDTAAILADTGTDGVVVAAASKTGYALSSAGVQAIWDAATSALTTVGSIGKLLVDNINATISSRSSHSAADVWASATRLLTAGTNIVLAKGTGVTGFNDLSAAQVNAEADTALSDVGVTTTVTGRIDAAVSSRLASAGYTTPPTATENADALLKRDMSAVTGESARSPLNALRALRNKVSISGGTVTVTKEDDATSAWTAAATTDAAAEPIISVDPS